MAIPKPEAAPVIMATRLCKVSFITVLLLPRFLQKTKPVFIQNIVNVFRGIASFS